MSARDAEAVKTWEGYAWPEWVPEKLREQIRSFWNWHGGLPAWLDDVRRNAECAPPLYAEAVCWNCYDLDRGRYVHAWNNMGRIVRADGTVAVVSGRVTTDAVASRLKWLDEQVDLAEKVLAAARSARDKLHDSARQMGVAP